MIRRLAVPVFVAHIVAACADSGAEAEPAAPAPAVSTRAPLMPEQFASLEAGSDIPPKPNAKNSAAYLAALERINPELVKAGTLSRWSTGAGISAPASKASPVTRRSGCGGRTSGLRRRITRTGSVTRPPRRS
jgi:hypothetical protein